jgi:hypothetical protein
VGGRVILVMLAVVIALAAVLYFTSRPKPQPVEEPRPFVWSVDMEELKTMAISLPHEGKREAWVKHQDQYWYFDKPGGPMVDMKRWGGGVPLLLSGPGANRRITEKVTDAQLEAYGLDDSRMRIRLTLENGQAIDIDVGDPTPDGRACYVRLKDAGEVYTVDASWYDVLEHLVLVPPYPESGER